MKVTHVIPIKCWIKPALAINILLFSSVSIATNFQVAPLSLKQAEQLSLKSEAGITSKMNLMRSLNVKAIAQSQLMDPKITIGLNNLPIDTIDFNQENMTQIKVGVMQWFPAGDTLKVKKQKVNKQAELLKTQADERKLMILKEVRLTYLEILYWEGAKRTITKNKALFKQLVNIVKSLFSVGKTNQQNLIRAQFELMKLDDRLVMIERKIQTNRYKLARWLGTQSSAKPFSKKIPNLLELNLDIGTKSLKKLLLKHPQILQMDKKLEVIRKEIAIIKESYKAGWGLNVSYGYRGVKPNGTARSDFISVAATFDLPLFTRNRQDKKVSSKELQYLAQKNARQALMVSMVSSLQQEVANHKQLIERHHLYTQQLIPQINQEMKASLLSYQSRKGDFSDLMKAYIDQLNVQLEEVRISVDHQKSNARILYSVATF